MKKYQSYKSSGVEWIGEIPSNWEVRRIKYLFKSIVEKSIDGSEELLSVSEKKGIIPRRELRDENEELTRSESLEGYLKVSKDDLVNNIMLMWKRGLGFSDYNGIVSPSYSVFRLDEPNIPSFWNYLLRTDLYVTEYKRNSTGVIDSRLRLYDDSFGDIYSILPPLQDQHNIVQFLNEKTELIDKIIKCIEKRTEILKEKRLVLIQKILLDHEIERIRLSNVVDIVNRPISESETTNYTRIGMYNWGRGLFKYDEEMGSELGDSKFSFIKEGDLILSGQFSWEGSVSIVESEFDNCIVSHRFHILNGKNNILLNEYLWGYFTSQEGHFLLDSNSNGFVGRNRPLNIGKLLKEKIPIPNLKIQNEVKDFVEIERKNNEYSQKMKLLLNEYRQSLISEVVTGKIKVTTYE